MTAQEGYIRAEEFVGQGHSHLCAAVMARGDDCLCKMEEWSRFLVRHGGPCDECGDYIGLGERHECPGKEGL